MKPYYFLISLLITTAVSAQPFNTEVVPENGSPKLLGKVNKEGFSENSYGSWFVKNYEAYTPDEAIVEQIREALNEYTITLFMGTWCGDSKREVPRFYKVLDAAQFPLERLTAVAVDRDREAYKQSPGGEEEGLNIHRVPTFVFYKDGKEVNRIVEHPVTSLEADILAIIKQNYTSNYSGVTLVNNTLNEMGVEKFRKKKKKLMSQLQPVISNWRELNTYSYLLFHKGEQAEAMEVARLNILLYPEESGTYVRLGHELKATGNLAEAQENYEQALALDPDNKELQQLVASVDTGSVKE